MCFWKHMKASFCCCCCSEHERLLTSSQGVQQSSSVSRRAKKQWQWAWSLCHSLKGWDWRSLNQSSLVHVAFKHLSFIRCQPWSFSPIVNAYHPLPLAWTRVPGLLQGLPEPQDYREREESVASGCSLIEMKAREPELSGVLLSWLENNVVVSAGPGPGTRLWFRIMGTTCSNALAAPHTLRLWKSLMMEARLSDYVRVLFAMRLWVYSEGSKHMPIKHGENYQWMFLNDQ